MGAEKPPTSATASSRSTKRRASPRCRNFDSQEPRPMALR